METVVLIIIVFAILFYSSRPKSDKKEVGKGDRNKEVKR